MSTRFTMRTRNTDVFHGGFKSEVGNRRLGALSTNVVKTPHQPRSHKGKRVLPVINTK